MTHVQIATQLFSILTILVQIAAVVMLISLFYKKLQKTIFFRFFFEKLFFIAFLVTLVSMLGSLYYSEIAGYAPCKLCWYQRILMYPQVLLLGIGYSKKDFNVIRYALPLSILGVIIALYHYLIQIGTLDEILPCTTVGYSVSCAEKFVMTFGYITIPMMSLSAFIFLTLAMIVLRQKLKKR